MSKPENRLDKWKPFVLVISGGGMKGIFGSGPIYKLEQNEMLDEVSIFCGTSIGSFICSLLCLGYSGLEIIDIFWKGNFGYMKNEIKIVNLISGESICDFEWFKTLIDEVISKKMKKNITLKELYDITGKELWLIAVSEKDEKTVVLNHKTFPDMKLKRAILCSTCLPGLLPDSIYEGQIYYDGGILNNYPVNLFNEDEVLGIHLGKRGKKNDMFDNIELKIPSIFSGIEIFLKKILRTLVITINENERKNLKNISVREIELDTGNIGLFTFNMTRKQKKEAILTSCEATEEFLKNPIKKKLYI